MDHHDLPHRRAHQMIWRRRGIAVHPRHSWCQSFRPIGHPSKYSSTLVPKQGVGSHFAASCLLSSHCRRVSIKHTLSVQKLRQPPLPHEWSARRANHETCNVGHTPFHRIHRARAFKRPCIRVRSRPNNLVRVALRARNPPSDFPRAARILAARSNSHDSWIGNPTAARSPVPARTRPLSCDAFADLVDV